MEAGVRVAMRDGVSLVCDIYRPTAAGHFPVLLTRTPYNRRDPVGGMFLASHGYIVIQQDTRGRFDSEGEFHPFRHEADDGYDTIEWAAALPYSDGRVGTFGGSYVGATQLLAASSAPPKTEPPDLFEYDPASPVRTIGGHLCCGGLEPGPFDQSPNESRLDVLVYSTPVLAQDVEVTGFVTLELYAATSAADTDFTAMLVDADETGFARYLADGIIRARFRESTATASPIEPGRIYQYKVDLWATSNVFKAGHRIRVYVSSSNFPRFNRNLNTGERTIGGSTLVRARQTIYHDADHPSAIVLPIIPRASGVSPLRRASYGCAVAGVAGMRLQSRTPSARVFFMRTRLLPPRQAEKNIVRRTHHELFGVERHAATVGPQLFPPEECLASGCRMWAATHVPAVLSLSRRRPSEEGSMQWNVRALCPRVIIRLAVAAAVAMVTAQAVGGQAPPAGKASGAVTIDDKNMRVGYAYAWAEPNTFEPERTDIVVLLTEQPVAPELFAGVEGLFAVGRRLQHFVLFAIDDTGALIREVIAHPALGKEQIQISGAARTVFTKKVLSAGRVEGAFRTTKTETVTGHRYAVKVDIAAAVVAAPRPEPLPDAKTGKPLPPGGGEPGKAYMAVYRAVAKKDATTVLNLLRKTGRTAEDEAQIREGIEFMAALQPSNAKIVRGFISGDRAALYVEGFEEKEKQYGTIEVVREDGAWRVGKQKWSSSPPGRLDAPGAGQAAGGDRHGMQSEAMLIVRKGRRVWPDNDLILRLRVDDNLEPIQERRRPVEIAARQRERMRR